MRDPFRDTTYLKFMILVPTPGGKKPYHIVRIIGSLSYRYEDDAIAISCTTTISDRYSGSMDVYRAVREIGEALLSAGAVPDENLWFAYEDFFAIPRGFYATAEATLSMVKTMETTYTVYLDSSDFDGSVKDIFENHFRKLHDAMWIKTVAPCLVNEVTRHRYEALLKRHGIPHTLVTEEDIRRIMGVNKVRFEP